MYSNIYRILLNNCSGDVCYVKIITTCVIFSNSFKFTLDELYPLMESVKLRSQSYKEWLSAVEDIVENKGAKKKGAT